MNLVFISVEQESIHIFSIILKKLLTHLYGYVKIYLLLIIFVGFMKILKLLPAMLLLNCIAPCKALENVLFYVASQPFFFKSSLSDLRYDIEEKIDIPLTDSEKKDLTKDFASEEGDVLRTSQYYSLKDLIKEYADLDFENPRGWFLSDYIPARVSFLVKFFLEKLLTNEVYDTSDQQQGSESELFEDYRETENLLQRHGYNDQKIREIFFLMNYLAESFNEIIPEVYHDRDNPIKAFRNVISFDLLSLLESKRHQNTK